MDARIIWANHLGSRGCTFHWEQGSHKSNNNDIDRQGRDGNRHRVAESHHTLHRGDHGRHGRRVGGLRAVGRQRNQLFEKTRARKKEQRIRANTQNKRSKSVRIFANTPTLPPLSFSLKNQARARKDSKNVVRTRAVGCGVAPWICSVTVPLPAGFT